MVRKANGNPANIAPGYLPEYEPNHERSKVLCPLIQAKWRCADNGEREPKTLGGGPSEAEAKLEKHKCHQPVKAGMKAPAWPLAPRVSLADLPEVEVIGKRVTVQS